MPISTHTLTWSVTAINRLMGRYMGISTHTLTWSVTMKVTQIATILNISTHTLTWSVTVPCQVTEKQGKFQLTRSRGA